MLKGINKILCIQLRQLGDVILTTPAVRMLRKKFPDSIIHFLTEKLGSKVYKNNPYIDKILIYEKKITIKEHLYFIKNLYKEHYDLVLDFFGNPLAAQFTLATMAKQRLGFDYGLRSLVYTESLQVLPGVVYSAQAKLCLLQKFITTAELDEFKPDFFINASDRSFANEFVNKHHIKKDDWVAFCPISQRAYKLWSKEQYRFLAKHLLDQGYKLFIVYGPQEKDLAIDMLGELNSSSEILISYEMPSVSELFAIFKHCKFFVGTDGGPKHIAVCANIPTLGIFINIDPAGWTPPKTKWHIGLLNPNSFEDCVRALQNVAYFLE